MTPNMITTCLMGGRGVHTGLWFLTMVVVEWGGGWLALAIVIDHRNILRIKQAQVKPNICSVRVGWPWPVLSLPLSVSLCLSPSLCVWECGQAFSLLSIWLVCADKAKRITLSCGSHSKCWKSKPLKHISFCLRRLSPHTFVSVTCSECVCVCVRVFIYFGTFCLRSTEQ